MHRPTHFEFSRDVRGTTRPKHSTRECACLIAIFIMHRPILVLISFWWTVWILYCTGSRTVHVDSSLKEIQFKYLQIHMVNCSRINVRTSDTVFVVVLTFKHSTASKFIPLKWNSILLPLHICAGNRNESYFLSKGIAFTVNRIFIFIFICDISDCTILVYCTRPHD
jgi:hypothetical protein